MTSWAPPSVPVAQSCPACRRRVGDGSSTSRARSGLTGVARATHYAAAKAGIIGLSASLAKELGPDGILVNAVAPTQIVTLKDGTPSIPDERASEMAKSIPVRRLATPDDLASLVVWLGSAANTYVSGETVSLTGGDQR